jgi:hypothetical protein
MSVVKKEYLNLFYDVTLPSDYDINVIFRTAPYTLPDWFSKAPSNLRKIVRVLGATATTYDLTLNVDIDIPKAYRLMGNLTKDFPSNEFIMMLNNYNSIKEFDVTYMNITKLDWYAINGRGVQFPDLHDIHMDLVIELELIIAENDN